MPVARIYQAAAPYNASELADIDSEQTADATYLAHPNHAPTKLIRYGHADWRFVAVAAGPTIAAPTGIAGSATVPNTDAANSGNAYFPQPASYCVTAINEDTGQESRASLTVTLTNDLGLKRNYNSISWSAVTGATAYRIYKADNTQTWGHVGTTTALSFRDDNIGADLSQGPPILDNPFSSSGNYPGTVTFHEQRSIWGRTGNRPNAVFFSRSADFDNMDYSRPSRADDAFVIGLVARRVNSVNQLVSTPQGLLALTSENIFVIQGANEDYISASPPPRVRPEIARGASRLNPIVIDKAVLFETAKGGEIRALGYQFEQDGIKTDDLTVFSRHLFEQRGIRAWAYAEKPASCVYVVRDDGKCLCMTFDQEQQVIGWTVYETDGLFKDVAVISEAGEDRAYFKVERVTGGATKTFIERMASEQWETQEDACYLDCARSYAGETAISVADRLSHLEGRTVSAWIDGQVVQDLVVSGGKVALPFAGFKVTVGLPFVSRIQTLPLAMQLGNGWNVARAQGVGEVVLKVVESRNLLVGPSLAQMSKVRQPDSEDGLGPIPLATGNLKADLPGQSGDEAVVFVESRDPTPMHLAAVLLEPKVAGG